MKQKIRLGDCYALTKQKRKQYTIRYLSLLAVVMSMCLYAVKQASAQVAEPAATAVANIKPLQIGDTIPEYLWHMPLQLVNHPEGKTAITLNEYRGKLIILDFWGTFCSSCIAAMPKINEVQRQFHDEMVVLPVSWSEPMATEKALLSHKTLQRLDLASIVEAQPLIDLFPHSVVPHYVWISPQGQVVATTASNDVSTENIAKVLRGEAPAYTLKKFIDIDKPLLLEQDDLPKDIELQHYSVLIRGHLPSLGSSIRLRKTGDTIYGMMISNRKLASIFNTIANALKGEFQGSRVEMVDSITDNANYSFEFIVPISQSDSVYPRILDMLNENSGYEGEWVKRRRRCFVLIREGSRDAFISDSDEKSRQLHGDTYLLRRFPMTHLVARLNDADISKEKLVINETAYNGEIDITLRAPFDDLENIRKQLRQQNLDLVETEREVDIFEIRKAPMPNNYSTVN